MRLNNFLCTFFVICISSMNFYSYTLTIFLLTCLTLSYFLKLFYIFGILDSFLIFLQKIFPVCLFILFIEFFSFFSNSLSLSLSHESLNRFIQSKYSSSVSRPSRLCIVFGKVFLLEIRKLFIGVFF